MLDTLEPRRLLSAGFPDATFGDGGVVTPAAHLPFEPSVGDVAVDDRGRIVIAGGHGEDALVMRLNPDGSLDRTFSRDGIYLVDFGFLREFATAVELLPDGRVLVLVQDISGAQTLMRLRGDGTPDPTFGRGGAVQATSVPSLAPYGLAVQDDGKILIAGDRQVQRFRTNGAPDRSFGLSGIWLLSHTSFHSMFIRDVRQVGDKIMLAGEGTGLDGGNAFALRLNGNGPEDLTYGDDGWSLLMRAERTAGLIEDDGSVLFAVHTTTVRTLLARLRPDGSVERGFGVNGYSRARVSSGDDADIEDLLLAPDGKILAAGDVLWNRFEDLSDGASVMRFNPDGAPDWTFSADGHGGAVVAPPSRTFPNFIFGQGERVALGPGGEIVIAGSVSLDSARAFHVARFHGNDDVTANPTTVARGRITLNGGDGDEWLAVQADERWVVAGRDADPIVARVARDRFKGATISGNGGDDRIGLTPTVPRPDVPVTYVGGPGADSISGTTKADWIDGGEGDDTIDGAAGDDRSRGGAGDDSLVSSEGDDTLDAGTGNDRLFSFGFRAELQGGDNLLLGGAGADTLRGDGFGQDSFHGGAGNDLFFVKSRAAVFGDGGNDRINTESALSLLDPPATVHGGAGTDTIVGDSGLPDMLFGDDDDDTITSHGTRTFERQPPQLFGGPGRDTLTSLIYSAQLFGDVGDDLLIANDNNGERDTLDGGEGDDEARADANDVLRNIP